MQWLFAAIGNDSQVDTPWIARTTGAATRPNTMFEEVRLPAPWNAHICHAH
eukprot:SAG31_NODE_19250_length_608_cov_1.070727_1_plen_50_part_10